tara:strand:+ start:572 stop:838 length:267 start_codon:yes stop_codon:yes gene_type:complete
MKKKKPRILNEEPKEPSTIKKAWNLSKSILDYAKSGFKNTPQDKYKERLTVCDSCELLDEINGTCTVCGCVMAVKAKWHVEKCPKGKW